MYFGKNIRYLREKGNISRKKAADAAGVKEKCYGHYETGYTMAPLDKAHKLSKFFKVSLNKLIEKDITPHAGIIHISHNQLRAPQTVQRIPDQGISNGR